MRGSKRNRKHQTYMKKILVMASLMVASLAAYGQGSVLFSNFVGPGGSIVNAQVFGTDGTTGLAGSNFQAILYAGPDAGSLAPIGASAAFFTGAGAGYFSGGSRTIGTVAPGASAFVQVRAWDTTSGATWDTATVRGSSTVFSVGTGGGGTPPAPPSNLVGLTSFSLVPEPSTIALGVLGAAALLLRRRK
jgi:hypothetical protein